MLLQAVSKAIEVLDSDASHELLGETGAFCVDEIRSQILDSAKRTWRKPT